MANKLIVSLSPHVHGGDSVQKNMYGVLIALIPALLVSFYMFGLGAVVVTLTSDFCHCMLVLRMGYHQIHIEARTYYYHGRFGCPDRCVAGI